MPEGGGDGERATETERERPAGRFGRPAATTKEEGSAHDRASIALPPKLCTRQNFIAVPLQFLSLSMSVRPSAVPSNETILAQVSTSEDKKRILRGVLHSLGLFHP